MFWFDRDHEDGNFIDNINLEVAHIGGDVILSSRSVQDNKEFIFLEDAGGDALELRMQGAFVSGTPAPACSGTQTHVYWAYFFEDSDRDDPDGPDGDIIVPE
jgi:hypothetical protein